MTNLTDLWKKWSFVVVLLMGIYLAYKIFTPAEVKIIKTEHIRTVTDTTETAQLKSQIVRLKQTVRQYSMSISEDEVRTEIRRPDGTVEIRVEKRKTTNTNGSSSTVDKSSSTTDSNNSKVEHKVDTKDTKVVQTTNPNPFWSTAIGYQYSRQQVLVGQGINIGRGWTGMLMGSYSFRAGQSGADIGAMVVLRY